MRRPFPWILVGSNVVLWIGTTWVVVRPLLQPREGRGDYIWGHYALKEIYVGVPLVLLTLLATASLLCPRQKRARFGARVGAVVVSALFAVGLFDLTYSLVFAGAAQPNYWMDLAYISRLSSEPDDELGFVRRPYVDWRGRAPGTGRVVVYRTDSNGFRNSDDLDRADVVFIGDSYTEAAQVDEEETFVQRVAAQTGLRATNLGRGVYGPQQELLVLRRFGLASKPRFVVWQVFEGNDLSDAENFAIWKDDPNGRTVPLPVRYMANSFFQPWIAQTERPKRGNFARLRLADGSEMSLRVHYRWREDYTADRARGWEEMKRTLREGLELCRSEGIELVVLSVPVMARVYAGRLSFPDPRDRALYLPPDLDAQRGFGPELTRFCAEIGCPIIDVHASLVRESELDPLGLFIPGDEHFDVRGHQVVARLLVDWIEMR